MVWFPNRTDRLESSEFGISWRTKDINLSISMLNGLHLSLTSVKIVSQRSAKATMKTPRPTDTTSEKPKQRLVFPTYDEADILNLDAVIDTPLPQQSGTIRVKLIYEEPSKPFPVENF